MLLVVGVRRGLFCLHFGLVKRTKITPASLLLPLPRFDLTEQNKTTCPLKVCVELRRSVLTQTKEEDVIEQFLSCNE